MESEITDTIVELMECHVVCLTVCTRQLRWTRYGANSPVNCSLIFSHTVCPLMSFHRQLDNLESTWEDGISVEESTSIGLTCDQCL